MISDNLFGADNQQGSRLFEPSNGLTPQRLHAELLEADLEETRAYLHGASRDGTFNRSHQTLRIAQADPRWLSILGDLFSKLGSRSWVYREGKRSVWVIETKCPIGHLDAKTETEKAAFIRGYFDAEGGVPRRTDSRFYIQMVQKNRRDLEIVHSFLSELGIESGRIHNPSVLVDPNYWRFYVRAKSHKDFISTVSSWHPRKRSLLEARMKI